MQQQGRGGGWQRGGQGQGPPRKPGGQRGGGSGSGRPQSREEQRQFFPPVQSPRGGDRPTSSRSGPSRQQETPPRFFAPPAPLPTQREAYIAIKPKNTGEVGCPPPMPPATHVQQRSGLCSLYTLKVEPGRKAYRYDVDIWRHPMQKRNGEYDSGMSLVKGADDGKRALNRNLCFELMTIAFQMTERFGMPNGNELVYDCKAIMFTSVQLPQFDVMRGVQIDIENENVNAYVRTYCGEGRDVRFSVKIQRNQAVPELDLNDFSQYESGQSVFNEDHSLRTFFEMAISQYAINNEIFVPIGAGKLFEYTTKENSTPVGNGMYLRHGLAKGVKVIKNDGNERGNGNGKPKAALVLDTKVSAFFEPQKLVYTVLDILPQSNNHQPHMNDFSPNDWRHVEELVKDLRAEVNYRKTRTFGLGRISEKPIKDLYLDVEMPNGATENMSVPEYFNYRYKIQLKFINLPGIYPNNPVPPGKKPEIFPLEVLNVMEDQRVPRSKTSPELMAKLLNANSLLPVERMDQIVRRANQLGIFHDQNPVLRAFGITVDQKSNRCVIGVRPLPKLHFQNLTVEPDKFKGDWRRDASRLPYLESAELHNWLVLCQDRSMDLVEQFVRAMITMARNKGISMRNPEIVPFRCAENNDRDWSEKFGRCAAEGIQFIMLIDQKTRDTHGLLKLYEAMYKPLVTQHVTFEKARDVVQKRQNQTLENILNKLNMKNFGLNYEPQIENCAKRFGLETGNVLVIGLDVSHPDLMSAQDKRRLMASGETELRSLDPSIAGICANMTTNPHAFVGDYFFQESFKEALDMEQLVQRTEWILRNLEQSRPNHARPPFIFIFRDGLSEGQFAMACKEELEAIRSACTRHDPSYHPKFVLVVGTKRHFKKFFEEKGFDNGRPKLENLVPGSVVQEKVVRADLTEFYLQAHHPLKGTGKPVEYAILEDQIGVNQDELQALLMSLCYSHQIVNVAISLPAPVYQADELAKRGRNNLAALKKFFPQEVPKRDIVPRSETIRQPMQIVDFRRVNEMLCYWNNGAMIVSHRFTA